MKKFTKEDIQVRNHLIRTCLACGMSKRKTAQIFGISRQRVHQIISEKAEGVRQNGE